MANYNTFVVYDCKARKNVLVTSSARKASKLLAKGYKVEVWNGNRKLETLYEHHKKRENNPLGPYISLEKEFIADKQNKATLRKKRKRACKHDGI